MSVVADEAAWKDRHGLGLKKDRMVVLFKNEGVIANF